MSVRPSTVDVPYGYEDDVSPYALGLPESRLSQVAGEDYQLRSI